MSYSNESYKVSSLPTRRYSVDLDRLFRIRYRSLLALILTMILSILFLESKLNIYTELRNLSLKSLNETKIINKSQTSRLNYAKRYPEFFKCNQEYNPWSYLDDNTKQDTQFNYSLPAPYYLHEKRFIRAVVVNFPINHIDHYYYELKWLYRSWTHMIKFEPTRWRTDLVIFVENDRERFDKAQFFLNELNCRFDNVRRSAIDFPMCILVDHKPFKSRKFPTQDVFMPNEEKYRQLFEEVNIYSKNASDFVRLYKMMKSEVNEYNYFDSIIIGFEGYFNKIWIKKNL